MIKGLLIILTVLCLSSSWSQQAQMLFRPAEIRIGEQATFVLAVEYADPKGSALVAWPRFDDELTEYIEIVDRTVDFTEIVDSTNKIFQRKQEFTVTCFEPGIHRLNPIGIEVNDSMYYTNMIDFVVQSVEVDTSKGIHDIKENYSVDYTFSEKLEDWFSKNWPYLAAGGGLLALFFIFRLVRNKRPEQEEDAPPPIPAHITALKALLDLKKKEAWLTENKKEYYSELTYTVRLYLEQRFGIQAIEHTTREIINDLRYADISEEDKIYLRKILSEADMVKFAKMKPDTSHGEESLNKSIDFVEKTKKKEEKTNE